MSGSSGAVDRPPTGPAAGFSVFELAAILLEGLPFLARVAMVGGLLAALPPTVSPSRFTSVATVMSVQQGAGGDARLRGLAVQFGLGDLGGAGAGALASPAFLVQFASLRAVRTRLLEDSTRLPDGKVVRLGDVLAFGELPEGRPVDAADPLVRERALEQLGEWMTVRSVRETPSIVVSSSTPVPEVSLALVNGMLRELNAFNIEIGRSQATQERRFIEWRLAAQQATLSEAERALSAFLDANRRFQSSPRLVFEHDRLQANVLMQRQIVQSLTQAQNEAAVREVRDTPVLNVLEPPELAAERDPKRRVTRALFGCVAGGLLGILWLLVARAAAGAAASGDAGANRIHELFRNVRRRVRRAGG